MCYFARHSVFSILSKVIGFTTVRTEMVYAKASFCQHEWWGSCFFWAMWKLTFYYVMIQHQVFMLWVISSFLTPFPSFFIFHSDYAFIMENCSSLRWSKCLNLESKNTHKIGLFKFFNFLSGFFMWYVNFHLCAARFYKHRR